MRKELNLGQSDFKNVIENNNYYIDKSLLIEEVLTAQKAVLLLPRPRRFGKTLNLSMLRYFFDRDMPENKELFKDLKIWQTDENIKKHCCKYPVIYLNFKDAKADTWEECFSLIINEIVKLYSRFDFLLKENFLKPHEQRKFNKILNEAGTSVDYQLSIKHLNEYLYRYYNEQIVILMDEYDVPIQSGYNKYFDKVVSFMRNMMSGAFKDNPYLFKGVITGILRVSKESIFTGLNNLSVYTILDDEFSDKFGFTEAEVKQLIKDFEVKTDFAEIKKWYNGYKFGDTEGIYNPWSILNYIAQPQEGFITYWSNTSSNDLIKHEILKKDAGYIRAELLKLLNNETVKKDIVENFVFTDLDKRKSLLWTLLAFSGYLTIIEQTSRREYLLKIPNYELRAIFQDTIMEWFEEDIKVMASTLEKTANYLINNKLQKFEQGFKQIIGDTFSYYDIAKNHEYVYQAYMLGLLTIIGDDYVIKSNKESGEGRYDIMLIPHDKMKNGVVMELKQIPKQQENEPDNDFAERINKELELASRQIDKNKYYKELLDNQIPEKNIIKVPVVFAGKEPYVTKIKIN